MSMDLNEAELRRIDLNLLLVFAAVMRERSVSRAAARLHLGASAISMSVARLRAVVGDELFVRMGSGMQPTPRAEELWAAIAPALVAVQQAMRGLRGFDPAESEAVIRFAAPDDLEFVLLPELLARLERLAPRMRLVVRPSDFRTLLDRLDNGDADLALSATPESGVERRHHVRTLHRDAFSVLFDPAMVGTTGPLDLETYLAGRAALAALACRGPSWPRGRAFIGDRPHADGARRLLAFLNHAVSAQAVSRGRQHARHRRPILRHGL